MAYSNELNERINKTTARWKNIASRKMFGGVCHTLNGNMFCGVLDEHLILRLGVSAAEAALQQTHVKPFSPTGKPMKGWVLVESPAFRSDDALNRWLDQAKQFVTTLPSK